MTTTFNPNATPFQPKSKPTVTQQPPSITPMYDPPMWNNAQQYYNFNYPAEVDEQRRYPQRALSGGIERSTHIQKNTMIKRYPTEGFNAGGRYRGRGQYPPTPVPSALPELTPFFKVPENTTPGPPPPSDDLRDAAYDSDLPPLPPTLWISGYGNETYTRYSLETMVVLFTKISRKPENIPKPDISEAAKITCLKQPDYSIALLELGALKQEEITVFDQSYFTKNSNSNTTGSNSNQVNNTQEKDNITDNSKTQKDHMKEELSSTTPSQDYHNSRNLSSPIFISRGATWPSYNMTHDTQEYEHESDSGLGIPQFKTLVSPIDLQSKPIDTIDLQSKPIIDIHNIFGN